MKLLVPVSFPFPSRSLWFDFTFCENRMFSGLEGLLKDCHRINQLLRAHIESHGELRSPNTPNTPKGLLDALRDASDTSKNCSQELDNIHKLLLDSKLAVVLNRNIGTWIDEKEDQMRIAKFEPEGKQEFQFDHYRREIHGIKGLNLRALGFVLWFLNHCFESILQILEVSHRDFEAVPRWNRKRWRERDVSSLEVENYKLFLLVKFIPDAAAWPIDEYLISRNKRLNCEEVVRCQSEADSRKLKKQSNAFYSELSMTNGFCELGYNRQSKLEELTMLLVGACYYGIRGKKAKERFNFLGTGRKDEEYLQGRKEDPDAVKFVKYVWNLPERGIVKMMYNMSYANIARHECFVISGPLSVPVRFLSRSVSNENEDSLIIHFHGGGFMTQTSFAHQMYTRQWALDQRLCPVLSVDYRLAPDHRYPAAPDDCFAVFKWVVENEEEVRQKLGYHPKKIFLGGDSAGGTLSGSVCIRAILENFKKPDGLLLVYPATTVDFAKFTPSSLLSQVDRLVPTGFIITCGLTYAADPSDKSKYDTDPVLCLDAAGDDILSQFPPTRFMLGAMDPLIDGSIRMAAKLERLGKNVKARVYEEHGHGFLSFDSPRKLSFSLTTQTYLFRQISGWN
jgi:acetyl esterase/lipase